MIYFQFRPIYGVSMFHKVDNDGWCKPSCNMAMTDMVGIKMITSKRYCSTYSDSNFHP